PEALRKLLGGHEHSGPVVAPPAVGEPGRFVGACRDEPFRDWRYREHPRFRYDLLEDDSGFAAYRIEHVAGSDAKVMRIVDLLGGERLARELVEAATREGVLFADFYCTSPRYGVPLQAAGFAPDPGLPGRFQPLDFSDR